MSSNIGIQNKWGPDELIMNYKDVCCIYGRDLDILLFDTSTNTTNSTAATTEQQLWLNDTILHYWLIRLQERYRTDDDASQCSSSLVVMDPIVVSYWIHRLDLQDVEECRNVWNAYAGFQNVSRLVIPINDTM